MSDEARTKKMVRFDFPPGATPAVIAAALLAARDRIMRDRAGEASPPPLGDDTTGLEARDIAG